MKLLLSSLILLSASCCIAQQTYFIKNNGRYVRSSDSADYSMVISQPDSGSTLYNVAEFYRNGNKKLTGKSTAKDMAYLEGKCFGYYPNGTLSSITEYKNHKKTGEEDTYYPNGKPYFVLEYYYKGEAVQQGGVSSGNDSHLVKKEYDSLGTVLVENGNGYYKSYDSTFTAITEQGRLKNNKMDSTWKGQYSDTHFTETYKDGLLITGKAVFKDSSTSLYTKAREVEPQFKGGTQAFYKFLGATVRYPAKARDDNTQGTAIVSFVVEKDGKLTDVHIIRSVSPEIDKEAIRVITKSPEWIPGSQFGRPVRVTYSEPLTFSLSGG